MRNRDCYEDEIDLYEVWFLLKKRKKLIVLSSLLFVSLACAFAFLSPPVYQLKHYFSNPISSSVPFQIESAVNVVNTYLENGDYGKLSELLKMKKTDLEKITLVRVPKLEKMRGVFSLIEEGESLEVLKNFDSKLLAYLVSLPSIRQEMKKRRELLMAQIEGYSKEIKDMENLANELKSQIKEGKLKIVGFNPMELDTTIVEYKAQLKELKLELSSLAPFKEVSFYLSDKPVKPKKELIVTVGFISGIFVGVFLALFLEWLENIKERRG
ncbi:lipopolysaccharide biosynthesis protein [Thermovibrio ammonificans HB-1]|uniref:Lipopolysaccharide biosynthesis protein n=1 Tax=Thermovibrio ammonificans (strain DSM 15698 / JCM 12110 / HB-1) TaxID=648996 RepID=E8T645_THEA1|nr:Wzz/FepE/Etk N-terminal domain-containing protein [Thermovibrio ammonificans]ADU96629.1 lipopolysaccharide biosynthesis protein [Thermovibrio ammonificans HB-1]